MIHFDSNNRCLRRGIYLRKFRIVRWGKARRQWLRLDRPEGTNAAGESAAVNKLLDEEAVAAVSFDAFE
jgi:hypothetical protein